MNLEQRLADAARHVAEQVYPPEVDVGAIRSRSHANQRRTLAATAAAALLTLALAGIPLLTTGRDTTAPPVAPRPTGRAVPGRRAGPVPVRGQDDLR